MNARIQWLCAVVVLGCACSASAPKVVQEPRLRDGLTLELNGEMRELEFILVDALGRADSLDVAGKPVAEIRGCTRRQIDPEASTDEDADRHGSYTIFEFDRSPDWPLELWWRGELADTVSLLVRYTVSNSMCTFSDRVPSAGGTRLSRVRIERMIHGKACALRIIRL